MKSVNLFAPVLAAICLLVSTPVSGQRPDLLAGSRGGRPTSGRGGTAAGQTAKGSGETAEQQIKTLLPQLKQAILKSDTGFFEKYYADDYIAIHGNGALTTKAQEIEDFKSGATKYESIETRETKMRTYGDTVVVNWLGSIKATFDGEPYSGDVRNTRVWVKQDGSWKIANFQATRVASVSQ